MKAVAVFPDSRQVKVIEQEDPRLIQPDQVMLRMLDVGICGTDKEICSFEYGTPPAGDDHLVIGHESLAEIVQVGLGRGAAPGGRPRRAVGAPPLSPSRLPGLPFRAPGLLLHRRLPRARHQGSPRLHGRVRRRPRAVHEPRACRICAEIAVLAEPLTIAEKALAQIFWMMQHRPPWLDPQTPRQERGRGLSALVLGIGPVGLLGAMTLATAGFTTYVYSREVPPNPRIDLVAGHRRDLRLHPDARRSATWPRRSATSTWSTRRSGTPISPCRRCRCWAPTASSC